MVLHLAVTIFAAFVGRHAEATNGSALGSVAQLGIATEISHENYLIEGHEEPFFSYLGLLTPRYYRRKTQESSEPKYFTR
jgi:hypothetical protein